MKGSRCVMENAMVKVFENSEFGKVRMMEVNGQVMFGGSDVAKALGYAKPTNAIAAHCKGALKRSTLTNGGMQEINFITEGDVLMLIDRSRTVTSDYKRGLIQWLQQCGVIDDSMVVTSRKEIEFVDSLEKTLEPFDLTIEKQYRVLSYRIDFYIKELNLAIEYDENNHSGYSYESQEGRQKEIEHAIGCTFLRLSDHDSDMYNIGLVMKQILTMSLKRRENGAHLLR